MAIFKYPNEKYLRTRFELLGVKVSRSTKTNKMREAKAYEEKLRSEIRTQHLLGKKPEKTWADAHAQWIKEKQHKKSLKDDILWLNSLEKELKNKSLSSLTTSFFHSLIEKRRAKGVSNATLNRLRALIKSILGRAKRVWGWSVPDIHFEMDKEPPGRVRWLTDDEALRLLSELAKTKYTYLYQACRFTLETGLRAANVKNLHIDHIDQSDWIVNIPGNQMKSGRDYHAPLSDVAIEIIKQQIKANPNSPWLFGYEGKPVYNLGGKAWQNALKKAGITNFKWHDLRHTWASRKAQKGTSLHILMELGGWTSMTMVLRYAHLSNKNKRDAIQTKPVEKPLGEFEKEKEGAISV